MAPKFPNPDPATDSVRDRLDQFKEVAGRAVYPPLAVAPSPTTAGQVWWDISSTVKIRNEANTAWADLLTVLGGQPAGSYQPSGGYLRYDAAQTLTAGERTQSQTNLGLTALARTIMAQTTGDGMFGSMGAQLTLTGGHMFAKLPNGLIIQGGIRTANGTDGYVPFGVSFPTSCFGVVVSPYNNAEGVNDLFNVSTFGWSVTGFSMRGRFAQNGGTVGSGGYTASYIAFGI